jgi:hypothetical protein
MKKITFLTVMLFSMYQSMAQLAIKITPVTVLKNQLFMVHGEWFLPNQDQISLSLGVAPNLVPKLDAFGDIDDILNGSDFTYEADEINYLTDAKSGFSFDPELRWYADEQMDGFFLGLYSSQRFSSGVRLDEWFVGNPTGGYITSKSRVSVYGVQLGFEKLFGRNDHFVFDFYIGGGVKQTKYTWNESNLFGPGRGEEPTYGLALRGNVAIGYAFGN